ncbi:MAG: translesion error-prone DNA polymerase V autoproteolytic subunit [Bacteroidales bacterium]|jgi:DNA polymerase V|nr:translesion error-prone DNA polymerase V autoproteolytic subunit [Bacteroidales bacterium]
MNSIELLPSDFKEKLKLHYAKAIKAGHPSRADDYEHEFFDFNFDLVSNPEATFYGRVEGDTMIEVGIHHGDIAVIDKSLDPQDGDLIVAYVNNEFVIKFLDLTHLKDGYIELQPANRKYKPIRIYDVKNFEVWGVVVWTITNWRK